jgi:hypothetical protein
VEVVHIVGTKRNILKALKVAIEIFWIPVPIADRSFLREAGRRLKLSRPYGEVLRSRRGIIRITIDVSGTF